MDALELPKEYTLSKTYEETKLNEIVEIDKKIKDLGGVESWVKMKLLIQ
mgnify:CR=1 FL=1